MVLKVLKFGTRKLFEKNKDSDDKAGNGQENGKPNQQVRKEYKIDFEALDKLLDREAQFEALQKEQACEATKNSTNEADNQGVSDYLAQFQVADIQNKGKVIADAPSNKDAVPELNSLLAVPEMDEDMIDE